MGKIFLLSGAFAARSPAPVQAEPNEEELAAIARKLRAEGFVTWAEIQPADDNPYWEATDARRADGQGYDLKLNPETLDLLARRVEASGAI